MSLQNGFWCVKVTFANMSQLTIWSFSFVKTDVLESAALGFSSMKYFPFTCANVILNLLAGK